MRVCDGGGGGWEGGVREGLRRSGREGVEERGWVEEIRGEKREGERMD